MKSATKEILAEIGVMGVKMPRNLTIPMMASQSETDLLNIQMTVMDMLNEDLEIANIVSNSWNLGVEIKAFNVQRQVWDLLDLENDLELPGGARIRVFLTNNDVADETDQKKINSRDEDVTQHVSATSSRDPRLKHPSVEPETVVVENSVSSSADVRGSVVNSEPNIKNLSRNDPRRRKLMKEKTEVSGSMSSLPLPHVDDDPEEVIPKKLHKPDYHEDSDSDDEGLQIDEAFVEEKHVVMEKETIMITENLLEEDTAVIKKSDDVELWDEIYGITNDDKDCSNKIFVPPKPLDTDIAKAEAKLWELVMAKQSSSSESPQQQGYYDERKSIEQLERERELLLSLVQERDKMNQIVANVPEEIVINDDLEEGELSDTGSDAVKADSSSESDVEVVAAVSQQRTHSSGSIRSSTESNKRRLSQDQDPSLSNPSRRPNINLDDFESPSSPTGIQLNLDNDEIDVIPLVKKNESGVDGPASPTGFQYDLDTEEIDVIPLERPGDRRDDDVVEVVPSSSEKYKKYWDEFPDEERRVREVDMFEVAREKLNKFKHENSVEKQRSSLFSPRSTSTEDSTPERRVVFQDSPPKPGPPGSLFKRAAEDITPVRTTPPGHLFKKAAEGITPSLTSGHKMSQMTVSNMTAITPRFPPPLPTMRKNIALLDTPPSPFPAPVKAVDTTPPLTSLRNPSPAAFRNPSPSAAKLLRNPSPVVFNSSLPPPAASVPPPAVSAKYSFPPPVASNYKTPPPSASHNQNSPSSVQPSREENNTTKKLSVWQEGCDPKNQKNVKTDPENNKLNTKDTYDRRRRSGSGDKNNTLRTSKSPRRERRRSRSRDRNRRSKSGERKRGNINSSRNSRDTNSRDTKSRDRDRRRSGSKERTARDHVRRRNRSGDEDNKSSSNARNNESSSAAMQASDNLMLAFYEGGDCHEEDVTPVPTNTSTGSKYNFPKPVPSQGNEMFPEPVPSTSIFMSGLNNKAQPIRGLHDKQPPMRSQDSQASMELSARHPVQGLFEYAKRMKYPAPRFHDRWGPGGGWAFDVDLGPRTYSSPWFRIKKKDAKAEACKYALQQLGINVRF